MQRLIVMDFSYFLSQIGDWFRVHGIPLKWFSFVLASPSFYQEDLWED